MDGGGGGGRQREGRTRDGGGTHKAQRSRCCEILNTLFAFEQTLTSFASYISLLSADILVVLVLEEQFRLH